MRTFKVRNVNDAVKLANIFDIIIPKNRSKKYLTPLPSVTENLNHIVEN